MTHNDERARQIGTDDAIATVFPHPTFLTFLLDRGLVGLAWANAGLVIEGTAGRLASWISGGQRIPDDLAPFHGLEDELHELMDDFRPSLVLPKIGLNVDGCDTEKTSLEVFWFEEKNVFILVLHRLGGQPEFEMELAQQLRARRLAEGNLAAMQREMDGTQGLLKIITEHAPVELAIFNNRLQYQFATQRWIKRLELEGQHIIASEHQCLTGNGSHAFDEGLQRSLKGHTVHAAAAEGSAMHARESDDRLRDTMWSHNPWFDSQGSVGGVVSAVHSVADIATHNSRLKARVDELERMNAELESFAVLLAHDVRAPISLARQKLSGLQNRNEAGTVRSEVESALERVLQITDSLLEFATTRTLAGPAHALDTGAMIRRIADDSVSGTKIRVAMDGNWPCMTTAAAPLDIVFRNLIQNVVKHHDTGHGVLQLSARTTRSEMVFEIADDGPGIPPSLQKVIFDPLVTVSDAAGKSTGLGLSFVRRAAQSVGGRIEVESDPACKPGTIFRVFWPLRTADDSCD